MRDLEEGHLHKVKDIEFAAKIMGYIEPVNV